MSQIIADSYEILQQIGSGGGGVVYLGRHLRLGKLRTGGTGPPGRRCCAGKWMP